MNELNSEIEKLLKVLDLPEEEQWLWCQDNLPEEYDFHFTSDKNYNRMQLADLAFRERDEVDGISFFDGRAEVYAYCGNDPNLPENPDDWEEKQLIAFTVNKEMWWCKKTQPIHWIIAAQIAKLLEGEK